MIGLNMSLENGDYSSVMSWPRYKRRKVSAIRDFPDGCGPQDAKNSLPVKEVGSSGQKDDVVLRITECSGEKGKDLCEVVKITSPEDEVNSKSHEINVCPNAVEVEKSSSAKSDEVQRGDEDATKLLMDQRAESLNAEKDTGGLDLIKHAHAEILDEGNSVKPSSLTHYPIPQNFVWKEPKYPPRRRASVVRDFPDGCGRNLPRLSDAGNKLDTRGEPDSKSDKAIVLSDINLTGGEHNNDNALKDQVQDLASEKVVDTLEQVLECEIPPLFRNSSEIKEQDGSSKENFGEHIKKDIEHLEYNGKDEIDMRSLPDGLTEESVVYARDKNKIKKSTGFPCTNVVLQEETIMGAESVKEIIIVQGLMSAPQCPWRQGEVTVKSTNTGVKKKKVKMGDSSRQTKCKTSPIKSKDGTKNLAEKGMMIPYLEEDIEEGTRPLEIRDNFDDSSEDDNANDFQFLPRGRVCDVSLPPVGSCSSSERGVRSKVQETLQLFQDVYRKLLQEEDSTKSRDQEAASKRADLRAAKILKDQGKYINTKKLIGSVPGVEVGDMFNYRIELAIIGLHTPLQGGIDTTKLDKQTVAISIVASGGYANDVDSSDVLIYTGQGGNATGADKQPEDQKLERGNLALKNCIDKKTLVRVIRGFRGTKPSDTHDGRAKMVATYTYDGLYTVVKYWDDLGPHGKLVYKFELRRVPGQPKLNWHVK
ncbi:unnamed protein product [Amaranthus hypochondriacus]